MPIHCAFPGTVCRVYPNSLQTGSIPRVNLQGPAQGGVPPECAPLGQLPRVLHPGVPPRVRPSRSDPRFCPPPLQENGFNAVILNDFSKIFQNVPKGLLRLNDNNKA